MKKLILIALFILGATINSFAQDRGFGIGIMMGEPSGLSGKYWLSKQNAIDGGLGWSFTENGSVHLHMDYLYHNYDLLKGTEGKAPLYFGIGGRFKFKNNEKSADNSIGVRVPVGLAYQFSEVPFDVFAEIVPLLDLSPDTRFTFNGAIGVRYYFK